MRINRFLKCYAIEEISIVFVVVVVVVL